MLVAAVDAVATLAPPLYAPRACAIPRYARVARAHRNLASHGKQRTALVVIASPQPSLPPRALFGFEIAESGTRLSACLPALANDRRWHTRLTVPPTPASCVAALAALAHQVASDLGEVQAAAAGVAVWGRVDAPRGVVQRLGPSAAWDGYPLRSALAAALGLPVAVASATHAAALAESARAPLPPGARLLYLHIGRTITSALVMDGAIEGVEGQLGHFRIANDGPRCSCGLPGHLEPIASAQSIVRRMIGLASDSDESHAAMQRVTAGRAEAMTVAQVFSLAQQGDAIAGRVVAEALDALAVALANVTALTAPRAIVLGGPLTEIGDGFLAGLRVRVISLTTPFTSPPDLRWGTLEPHAALYGAARVAELA